MAATALLKFVQGATTGADGHALFGVVGTSVVLSNVDNTGVKSWQIDLVYADSTSAVVPATPFAHNDDDSTPTLSFTPDVPGGYRWVLSVWSVKNRVGIPKSVDIRWFGVKEANGLFVPPAQVWPLPLPDPLTLSPFARPNEANFGSNINGWAGGGHDGLVNDALKRTAAALPKVDDVSGQVVKYVGLAGLLSSNLTGPAAVGAIAFDPTKFPNRVIVFETILSTSSGGAIASIRLYNVTDGEVVTGTLLTTASLVAAEVVSSALVVGSAAGNLKPGLRQYEIQLYRNGGGASDFATCNLAQLSLGLT